MNRWIRMRWLCVAVFAAPLAAQETRDAKPGPRAETVAEPSEKAAASDAAPRKGVVYTPPRRGSPRAKVGGGVRGIVTQPRPLTLAPPHLALTVRPAPVLYWYVEALPEPGTRTLLTITAWDAIDPVLEQEIAAPQAPGIQRIDLEALGVSLEPEREYQWSISVVRDVERRDLDLIDSSYLLRVVSDSAPVASSTAEWAANSLWYEALDSALLALSAEPSSARAQADLEALLRQAGLMRALPDFP